MAPTKKTKKTADSINSRLALVMKSGKGTILPELCWTPSITTLTDSLALSSYLGIQIHSQDPTIWKG
jgi:hypothetical protein